MKSSTHKKSTASEKPGSRVLLRDCSRSSSRRCCGPMLFRPDTSRPPSSGAPSKAHQLPVVEAVLAKAPNVPPPIVLQLSRAAARAWTPCRRCHWTSCTPEFWTFNDSVPGPSFVRVWAM